MFPLTNFSERELLWMIAKILMLPVLLVVIIEIGRNIAAAVFTLVQLGRSTEAKSNDDNREAGK